MTKVQICIRHNSDEYLSTVKELNTKQLNALKDEVLDAANGRVDCFVVNTGVQELYFPKPVLISSVIALIYVKE